MKAPDALRVLAELSTSQWGLFTAAQAADRGVSRVTLARLVDAEQLVRLAHGVYRDAGAPTDQFEDLRAAWLSIYPKLRAELRLQPGSLESTPASGTSAATLHGIGDHYVGRFEFTTAVRRQSQRPELRYRIRELDPVDVTIKEGLPVMTLERTIADLVEERYDLSNVAIAIRDADRQRPLNEKRMVELLSPLAARNGLRRGDGVALWELLTELAGIDSGSTVDKVASDDLLGRLIATKYLAAHGITLDELLSRPLPSSDDPAVQRELLREVAHSSALGRRAKALGHV
ncbi:MAG: transcriptional regulator [Pseudonocardiales bacterium]|nr:MAG: transcriptional regulator [Pseudonocardiales bacterium]